LQDLGSRLRQFAIRVITLCEALPHRPATRTIGKQLLRSGTSVGAHYAEATHARSNDEFTAKLDLALQELAETAYWLDLLSEAAAEVTVSMLQKETDELRSILITISKKVKHPVRAER
jgi:four helix bundle protein